MIRIGEIENCVAQHNQQFLVIPNEHTGERMVLRLDDDALPCPLPELGLGCPELLRITADYESCVLPFFSPFLLLLLFAHVSLFPLNQS